MSIACVTILFAAFNVTASNVVGYENQTLPTNALVRITPNFDPLGTFPTMKDVLRFNPPEAFVGCQLIVDFDGKHWVYDVLSYMTDESDYKLSALRKGCRYNSALDGIPAQKSFCIRTMKTTPLCISTDGQISGKYAKTVYGAVTSRTTYPSKPFKLEIKSKDGKRWLPLEVEPTGLSVKDASHP